MNVNRNTDAIVNLAKMKTTRTKEKVEMAISTLIIEEKIINFNSVSSTAKVSKSWLYNTPEIRRRIETLREAQQNGDRRNKKQIPIKEESANIALIATLKLKIKKLEKENKQLREQIEIVYGKKFSEL